MFILTFIDIAKRFAIVVPLHKVYKESVAEAHKKRKVMSFNKKNVQKVAYGHKGLMISTL